MLEPGHALAGRYRIERTLGSGGMGHVYEAVHTHTGRRVAVKVLRSDEHARPETLARFEREARVSAQLETPHVVQVLDAGYDTETRQQFLVMEHLRGEDLQSAISRVGALPPPIAVRIAMQACLGLSKAHAAGIIHRDVKAANVFLAESGDDVVVKLLDFGIAKAASVASTDPTLTRTGSVLGSPLYMSPEQAHGDAAIDARTDLWSLGVVIYEMLTGRAPHADHTTFPRLLMAICHEPPPDLATVAPWVDAELAKVVHKALSIDREGRYPTADELRAALAPFSGDGTALRAGDIGGAPEGRRRVVSLRPMSPSHEFATTEIQSTASTTRGASFEASRTPAARGGGAWRWAAPVAACVAIGAAVLVLRRGSTTPPDTTPAAQPAASAQKTVTVRVDPPSATAKVDGVVVALEAGFLPVSGALGSVHRVVVSAGDVSVERDVVVSAGGAFPSAIALAPAAPSAPSPDAPRPATDARPTDSRGARPTSAPPTASTTAPKRPAGRIDATEGFE